MHYLSKIHMLTNKAKIRNHCNLEINLSQMKTKPKGKWLS